jgi:hypothetical protein
LPVTVETVAVDFLDGHCDHAVLDVAGDEARDLVFELRSGLSGGAQLSDQRHGQGAVGPNRRLGGQVRVLPDVDLHDVRYADHVRMLSRIVGLSVGRRIETGAADTSERHRGQEQQHRTSQFGQGGTSQQVIGSSP